MRKQRSVARLGTKSNIRSQRHRPRRIGASSTRVWSTTENPKNPTPEPLRRRFVDAAVPSDRGRHRVSRSERLPPPPGHPDRWRYDIELIATQSFEM
jgi:hypothetical protein